MRSPVRTINLECNGIELFLGPLETVIMTALWEGITTSHAIWDYTLQYYQTPNSTGLSCSSVTATLYRMTLRGLITRTGDKRGFIYAPCYPDETSFIIATIVKTFASFARSYPDEFKAAIHYVIKP